MGGLWLHFFRSAQSQVLNPLYLSPYGDAGLDRALCQNLNLDVSNNFNTHYNN